VQREVSARIGRAQARSNLDEEYQATGPAAVYFNQRRCSRKVGKIQATALIYLSLHYGRRHLGNALVSSVASSNATGPVDGFSKQLQGGRGGVHTRCLFTAELTFSARLILGRSGIASRELFSASGEK
jgi:hypothetical protein